MPGVRTRSTSTNEPALVMETPHPGDEFAQVVLAQDESGVVTWNFPRTDDDAIDVTRGGGTLTYVIRRYVPPPASQADAQTRGLLGAVGKKVLKVLAFPVVDKAIGRIAEPFGSTGKSATGRTACARSPPRTPATPMARRRRTASGVRTATLAGCSSSTGRSVAPTARSAAWIPRHSPP